MGFFCEVLDDLELCQYQNLVRPHGPVNYRTNSAPLPLAYPLHTRYRLKRICCSLPQGFVWSLQLQPLAVDQRSVTSSPWPM